MSSSVSLNTPRNVPIMGSSPLYFVFEKLIDRKINQVAVGIFNRIVNFIIDRISNLCERVYPAYHARLQFRLNEESGVELLDIRHSTNTSIFIAGAPIYNRSQHVVTVVNDPNAVPGRQREQICIKGWPIDFNADNAKEIVNFGEDHGTLEIVIEDISNLPGWIKITETATDGAQLFWQVNTQAPEFIEIGRPSHFCYEAQEILGGENE